MYCFIFSVNRGWRIYGYCMVVFWSNSQQPISLNGSRNSKNAFPPETTSKLESPVLLRKFTSERGHSNADSVSWFGSMSVDSFRSLHSFGKGILLRDGSKPGLILYYIQTFNFFSGLTFYGLVLSLQNPDTARLLVVIRLNIILTYSSAVLKQCQVYVYFVLLSIWVEEENCTGVHGTPVIIIKILSTSHRCDILSVKFQKYIGLSFLYAFPFLYMFLTNN